MELKNFELKVSNVVPCERNDHGLENDGKRWKTMENDGKRWKTMENDGKRWKTMEINGEVLALQHSLDKQVI